MITKDDIKNTFHTGVASAFSITMFMLLFTSSTMIVNLTITQGLVLLSVFGWWIYTGFEVNKFLKFYLKIK